MDLSECYLEEDLFPKIFADYEERNYGILFYQEDNKDSFDSNHAVIYKDKIKDLQDVLSDIVHFYRSKGIRPIIYQSMLDDNWFGHIKEDLAAAGFRSWVEDQEYMLPAGENLITPNPKVEIRKVTKWKDELEKVFREAEEPWEIKVARKTLEYPKAWMFTAYQGDKPVGLLYGHLSKRACRVDYLLVSKKHRKTGIGRTLFYQYMEWCKENGIHNIYIWPDGDTPKRIYEEGGFRIIETRKAGRAVFEADWHSNPEDHKQAHDLETVKEHYINVIKNTPEIEQYARWEYGKHPTDEGLRSYIENGEMYLLTDRGIVAGMVAIVMHQGPDYETVPWAERLENDQVATLHLLAVCPEYQGRALGITILELADELAKQQGKRAMRLDVLESNLPAQHMYEKAGYVYRGKQRWYAENTGWTNFLLYEKSLIS